MIGAARTDVSTVVAAVAAIVNFIAGGRPVIAGRPAAFEATPG
jgi:hypothetical protein